MEIVISRIAKTLTLKKCTNCLKEKTPSEFYKRKDRGMKCSYYCKRCQLKHGKQNPNRSAIRKRWVNKNRERAVNATRLWQKKHPENLKLAQRKHDLKHKYGITLKQHEALLMKQSLCCGICQKDKLDFKMSFAVDHCHTTGKVRGLLCSKCNTALGLFNDDIKIMKRAIQYLKS